MQYIMKSLPGDVLQRFQSLRTQCVELRQIAQDLKRPGMGTSTCRWTSFNSAASTGCYGSICGCSTRVRPGEVPAKDQPGSDSAGIQGLEKQIAQLPADDQDPRRQRVCAALQDNLETSRSRLANLNKAQENCQFIGLEIDRLENKIRSLSEMAINRQEPEFISSEVDHVASSMVETEKTMNELQFATGLNAGDNEPPELLRAPAVTAKM